MEDHEWVEISLERFERNFLPKYLGKVDDSAIATLQKLANVAARSDAYPFLVCFPCVCTLCMQLILATDISIPVGSWVIVHYPRRESSY